MKNNCPVVLGIAIALASNMAFTKERNPGDAVGRDLNYPGIGWLGHVGLATEDISTPDKMNVYAWRVIEVLKESPVGQINWISTFKGKSRYWGSKYGIINDNTKGFYALVEANHQRWWCPEYTSDTNYRIGSGNVKTGERYVCGRWRCDTYVWWALYSQGYNSMPELPWLPLTFFNNHPYFNAFDNFVEPKEKNQKIFKENIRTLEQVNTQELNDMAFEEFQMIMDNPHHDNYVTSAEVIEMQLAENPELNDEKRRFMLDRLTATSKDNQLVHKFLSLYNSTDNQSIKEGVVTNMMFYNQDHQNEKTYKDNTKETVKAFFEAVLEDKSLNAKAVDTATRGFIDTHNPDEIMNKVDSINNNLKRVNSYSSVMIKYSLMFTSRDLEKIYVKSIIDQLRKENNRDLDSYLFGPLSMGLENSGKELLLPESREIIMQYIKDIHENFTPNAIKANKQAGAAMTVPYYNAVERMLKD